MKISSLKIVLLKKLAPCFALFFLLLISCSDDKDGIEYFFDREVLDMSVLRECATPSTKAENCFLLRFRYPIERNSLKQFHLWLDTLFIDDTSKSVSSKALQNSIRYKYTNPNNFDFDTIDLTPLLKEYLDRDSLQLAIWPEYTDKKSDEKKGSLQRIFVHFGDDLAPSRVSLQDSVWSTGAVFDWARPTDQVDFYKPNELSGPIVGYNIVVYAQDKTEDLRKTQVFVTHQGITDKLGDKLYKRHHRIRAVRDSIWLDSTSQEESVKNYLRLVVLDGEGFDFDSADANRFRLHLEGLLPQRKYTIGISAWDSSGNSSGTEGSTTVENNQLFMTTDPLAPLMPAKIFSNPDSIDSKYTQLDSNNRVFIYWSESVDPLHKDHQILRDSILNIPVDCLEKKCFRPVEKYLIDRFYKNEWKPITYAGGSLQRFSKHYDFVDNAIRVSSTGTLITDTIRWVLPGDSLILRIRSVDSSGYYSAALIDTLFINPSQNHEMDCPPGFSIVPSDTSYFCIETYEHRDANGIFVSGVLHAEAIEACESMSVSNFTVGLCKESEWQKACLSGGSSTYGVIEDNDIPASEYLFSYCNVGTNDSNSARFQELRDFRCANRFGIRDLPGQYQEWTLGRSPDTLEVLKGSSYKIFADIERESIAMCTNRFFPYYTRLDYTQDSVFLYLNGTSVDTSLVKDSLRTLYSVLTKKDFKDTLQFFNVKNPKTNKIIGEDYVLVSEYKKGGEDFIQSIANGLIYEASKKEAVFLLQPKSYLGAAAFYKDASISFRCCAYPK